MGFINRGFINPCLLYIIEWGLETLYKKLIESTSDQVQSVYKEDDLVYGLFTTADNSAAGSAICAFKLDAIDSVFDSSPFKVQSTVNANWLPVAPPKPRPGRCSNPEAVTEAGLNFVKHNVLMDEAVKSINNRPMLVKVTFGERLTSISLVEYFNRRYLLAGSTNGRIFKYRMSPDSPPELTETVQALSGSTPVRRVTAVNNRIVAVSEAAVASVPLVRCDAFESCTVCAQDQFQDGCGWNLESSQCQDSSIDIDEILRITNPNDCPYIPEPTTTTTTTSSTTTTASTSPTTATAASSLETETMIKIPFGVLEINDRANRDCPRCECDCPQTRLVQIYSSASTSTSSTTSSSTTTEAETESSFDEEDDGKNGRLGLFLDLLESDENEITLEEKGQLNFSDINDQAYKRSLLLFSASEERID